MCCPHPKKTELAIATEEWLQSRQPTATMFMNHLSQLAKVCRPDSLPL